MQILEPEILERIPPGKSETPRDVFIPLLRERGPGPIGGYCAAGYFSDVGTWDRLLETHRERLPAQHPSLPDGVRVRGPVYVAPSAVLHGPIELGPGVTIGADAVVRGPAQLSDFIVLPGSRVGPGTYRRGAWVGDQLLLAPDGS
jgi:NDP-sugar pyrophosphorylase family protein